MKKELILRILKYIEETERAFDAEYGSVREFPQILNEEPSIREFYSQVKEAYDEAE